MTHQSYVKHSAITALITSVLVCTAFLTIYSGVESSSQQTEVSTSDNSEVETRTYRERRSQQRQNR